MSDDQIHIQMLGGFRISSGEHYVEELTKKAPKFWKLLQYLIIHRHKSIPQEELISALWPDSEQSDPGNAIRNMVFRIRAELVKSGLPRGKEILLHNGVGYAWNNNLNCVADFEEFEKLYKQSEYKLNPEQARLEMLLQAIEIYKGDFLPSAGYEQWAMPSISYYRAIYFKCVYTALSLLMDGGQYSQAEMTCKKALLIDRLDETVHEYHLRSLVLQGRRADALDEYQKMETLLYEDMGVSPSESLRGIYTEIQRLNNDHARPLEDIMREWTESAGFTGAYYCEYGVFRTIYQIEARSIERTGSSVYLCSLEVNGDMDDRVREVMRRLYSVIQSNLRKGDIFTRAGPGQYLIMLHNLSHENCKVLRKRILQALDKKYRSHALKTTIKQVDPIH